VLEGTSIASVVMLEFTTFEGPIPQPMFRVGRCGWGGFRMPRAAGRKDCDQGAFVWREPQKPVDTRRSPPQRRQTGLEHAS